MVIGSYKTWVIKIAIEFLFEVYTHQYINSIVKTATIQRERRRQRHNFFSTDSILMGQDLRTVFLKIFTCKWVENGGFSENFSDFRPLACKIMRVSVSAGVYRHFRIDTQTTILSASLWHCTLKIVSYKSCCVTISLSRSSTIHATFLFTQKSTRHRSAADLRLII